MKGAYLIPIAALFSAGESYFNTRNIIKATEDLRQICLPGKRTTVLEEMVEDSLNLEPAKVKDSSGNVIEVDMNEASKNIYSEIKPLLSYKRFREYIGAKDMQEHVKLNTNSFGFDLILSGMVYCCAYVASPNASDDFFIGGVSLASCRIGRQIGEYAAILVHCRSG